MEKLPAISCLLLAVEAVTAQTAQTQIARLLPQWLTGIIAVSAFLFLVFVTFLVKRAWCDTSSREKTTESVRENQFVLTDRVTFPSSVDSAREKTKEPVSENVANENHYASSLDLIREKTTESARQNESVGTEEGDYATSLNLVRSKDNPKAFDNPAMDSTDSIVSSM
uniref:PDZK1-interacting protein 1 n=1 Tax=Scatophagus argus TaxID=75038 RepID=UPI001ED7CF04|nr:PDZK1-interacting protein 1 [Scatophagus argus]